MADANKHITYSLADIQRYLQGGMSAKEMHDLERAALEDPFLADALEGYSEADMQQTQMHLAQIETAIRQQKQQGSVVVLPPRKKYLNWQIAAAVALFICITGVTYFIFYKKTNDSIVASNESKPATPNTDTMQAFAQKQLPASTDTNKAVSESKIPAVKDNSLFAKNKKVAAQKRQQPASHAPAPMAARMADTSASGANNRVALRTPTYELAGTITDNHQQPVPNATVLLQDSTQAVTDRNGAFHITTDDSMVTASITAFGYKPLKNRTLKSGYNNITLKEKPFLLSDVEVTNIGTTGKKSTDTTTLMPEGGWQSFREYVYQKLNKKYDSSAAAPNVYINGDLQLEFSISDAGEPIDFKVLHTPDDQTASQAISAIKAGPKWKKGNKKDKMRMTIRYK